jgi:hypothetical protein
LPNYPYFVYLGVVLVAASVLTGIQQGLQYVVQVTFSAVGRVEGHMNGKTAF